MRNRANPSAIVRFGASGLTRGCEIDFSMKLKPSKNSNPFDVTRSLRRCSRSQDPRGGDPERQERARGEDAGACDPGEPEDRRPAPQICLNEQVQDAVRGRGAARPGAIHGTRDEASGRGGRTEKVGAVTHPLSHKSRDALVPAPRSGSVVDATPFPRLMDRMNHEIETANGPETTRKMKTANHQVKTPSILLLQTRMRGENAIRDRTE